MTLQAPPVPPSDVIASPPQRRPIFLWPLRISTTVLAAGLIAQPVLAGRFLQGDYPALSEHSAIGSSLGAVMLLVIASAVIAWRPGRYPGRFVPISVVLFVLIGLQIGMGHARVLAIHIPLGVAIVMGGLRLCAWSWWPGRDRA